MRFEVRDVVSDEALEAMSGLTAPSTVVLRQRSFDRFRILIDAAAKLKVSTLLSEFIGAIILTSEDLRCVPPQTGEPSFGSSAGGLSRPAPPIGGASVSPATTSSKAASQGPAP